MSVAALAFAATACDDKKEDLGVPQITLEPSEISVELTGTTTTIELTAKTGSLTFHLTIRSGFLCCRPAVRHQMILSLLK